MKPHRIGYRSALDYRGLLTRWPKRSAPPLDAENDPRVRDFMARMKDWGSTVFGPPREQKDS